MFTYKQKAFAVSFLNHFCLIFITYQFILREHFILVVCIFNSIVAGEETYLLDQST